jgi:hypothetical protein
MILYNGKWLDSFNVKVIEENKLKRKPARVMLETPCIDYCFTKEQWLEFKEKVNKV